MNRKQLRERVETLLQDPANKHWSDGEINSYINDALNEFTRIVRYPQVEGYATNGSSTNDLGEATKTGTLSVDGKTATITFTSDHGYSDGDAIKVFDGAPTEFIGTFIVRVPSSTTISYKVSLGEAVTDASVSVFRIGPDFTIPSTVAEISSISIDGRELSIYTESELNAAASSRGYKHFMLESSMGFHPNAFTSPVTSIDNTPRWREQNGSVEAAIFNNRTASTFRIFPLPKENKDLYEDKDATSKVFLRLKVRGVPKDNSLATDTSSPQVNSYWHESIVWGTLERAYLKESQQRDTNKSAFYRQKFLENATQASTMEGMTSGSISEGRNQSGFRVNRYL
tara:strand:+ start:1732 stop:2754 length:1023 start_codon:yes stop_codon:yes gene_type:complete